MDGVAMGNLVTRGAISGLNDPDDDHFAKSMLPGASGKSQNDGSRNTRPDIRTSAVAFSSTGREWAAATTQGLQVRQFAFGEIKFQLFLNMNVIIFRYLPWMMEHFSPLLSWTRRLLLRKSIRP